jgi:hypothetical protein
VRVWQPDAEAVHARYATGERPYWSGVKRTANGEQCERRRGVWLGRTAAKSTNKTRKRRCSSETGGCRCGSSTKRASGFRQAEARESQGYSHGSSHFLRYASSSRPCTPQTARPNATSPCEPYFRAAAVCRSAHTRPPQTSLRARNPTQLRIRLHRDRRHHHLQTRC